MREKVRDPRATVNVPITYVFRPVPRNWVLTEARVVAWSELHRRALQTQVDEEKRAAGLWVPPAIFRPVEPVSTGLRLEVKCPGKSARSYANVEREFIPDGLLPLAATTENSPTIESNWFAVLVDIKLPLPEDHGLGLGLQRLISPMDREAPPPPVYPERNPWRMRNEFFAVKQGDNDGLLAFLNKWGTWGFDPGKSFMVRSRHLYRPQDFWALGNDLRKRSVLPAKKWLETAARLPAWNSAEHPVYVLNQGTIRQALEDSITLEKMKQTEHALCEREGCGNIIAKTGKRPKRFCNASCGLKVRQQRFWSIRRKHSATL